MLKKISVLFVFALFGAASLAERSATSAAQDTLVAFRDNNCVTCHARSNGLQLDNRYFQWHSSLHREKAVGCEKCHGGDPTVTDKKKAHAGLFPPADARSRLSPKNLPETCGSCHQGIVSSFVESKHYQRLTSSGLGPSCSTCHVHMGSEIVSVPQETAALCSTCHDSANALMPKRPEIPGRASEIMLAIKRANGVVAWADRLIEDGRNKKVDIGDQEREMKIVHAMLAEAKLSWHAFNLDAVRRKADASFEAGTQVKDELRNKIYPQQ
ncbi:MAG TPA: multiheme c-type cytochrome [Blastocatellia bacterium]|nr:multiheme c-type cytochrome [Blastocatellia bacterium]